MSFLRQYLAAVSLFTRVPVSGALAQWAGFGADTLRAGAAHFPGVGWLAGLVACTVFALLGLALPDSAYGPLAAAVACTAATILLTGASHEEGLAHLADGLAVGAGREESLERMKGSHLGTHGTLALLLALLAKVTLLAVLAGQSPGTVLAALFAAHVVSRFWPLLLMRALPYIGDASTASGKLLAQRIDAKALAIGAGWCVGPLALAVALQMPAPAITGVMFSALAWFAMQRLLARRLEGFTADGVGATQQVCEIGFYLGAAVALGLG